MAFDALRGVPSANGLGDGEAAVVETGSDLREDAWRFSLDPAGKHLPLASCFRSTPDQ